MAGARELLDEIAVIGRDTRTGGYRRAAWTVQDAALREWFAAAAAARGLDVEADRNGNLWAWWGTGPGPAVVTGSHLDSVPDGGAYDGPLGVVSALAAVDSLRARGVEPAARPLAVVLFADEEGARFGVACAGSRLLTGTLDPDRARRLTDDTGTAMAEAMAGAGVDPAALGADPDRVARIGAYVELHIEQGRHLVDVGAPVGVASRIWPHGRWRLEVTGRADHAGTTRLEDRADPMLTVATTVLAAREKARRAGALATVGRLQVEPGATNAVPSRVRAWLDARAADEDTLRTLVDAVVEGATQRAAVDGTALAVTVESVTTAVDFPPVLRDRVAAVVGRYGSEGGAATPGTPENGRSAPLLPTGAGHDAGVLAAAGVPAAMLFVRNPTGVSHAPAEHAEDADVDVGVDALTAVLADLLAGRGAT